MNAVTSVWNSFTAYCASLMALLSKEWRDMTPTKYLILLLCIGAFGWMWMKSGAKGPGE